MTHALPRHVTSKNPCMVRGEGIYFYDSDGKRYIDGASGAALVCNIGHGVREAASALSLQAEVLAYNPFHCSHSRPYEEMAERLVRLAPPGFGRVFSVSSGLEAVENAVKFARQYHVACGAPSKHIVICRWQSYHGSTSGAMAYSGLTGRRRKHAPSLKDAVHIPPAVCYRCYFEKTYPSCELKWAERLTDPCMERGLIVYPGHGTVDGAAGDHLLIGPPLVIASSQVDELLAVLADAVDAVEREILN